MKFLIFLFCLVILYIGQNVSFAENTINTGDVVESEITYIQGNQYNKPNDESTTSPWWEHFFKEIITGAVGIIFALALWKIQKGRRTRRE